VCVLSDVFGIVGGVVIMPEGVFVFSIPFVLLNCLIYKGINFFFKFYFILYTFLRISGTVDFFITF
jgi:hypothetical protein